MSDTTTKNTVTVEEAAILLSTSPEAIRKRIYRGTITAKKDDGRWMVFLKDDGTPASKEDDTGRPTGQDAAQDAKDAGRHAVRGRGPSIDDLRLRVAVLEERIHGLEISLAAEKAERERWYQAYQEQTRLLDQEQRISISGNVRAVHESKPQKAISFKEKLKTFFTRPI
jgi:hypothetical protein